MFTQESTTYHVISVYAIACITRKDCRLHFHNLKMTVLEPRRAPHHAEASVFISHWVAEKMRLDEELQRWQDFLILSNGDVSIIQNLQERRK